MAQNRKRKYHRPPAQKNTIHKPIRVSQCMIVKNEEKNIRRALSWAGDLVFEKIVVDTGSTDRTVEIAESLGAKVLHFEWINDFSAAKNFAIEQAKGDWIAFLDADEYFPEDNVATLKQILRNIDNDPKLRKMKTAIRCQIVNVDDEGKPFMLLKQDRIFRNTPEIRYSGTIHEVLGVKEEIMQAAELSIIHTGYTQKIYDETGKAERNVLLIREELRRDPDNPDLKCYLADSLRAAGTMQDIPAAEALYREAINSGLNMVSELKQGAYNYIISAYFDDAEKVDENFEFCRKAYEEFPENPDFCYYYGRKLYLMGNYELAWEKLTESEAQLKRDIVEVGNYVLKNPLLLFFSMVLVAEELGNIQELIRCATLVLKEDKYQHMMLAPYIQAFNRPGFETSASDIFTLLKKMYDFNNPRDKLTVLQAAKSSSNIDLCNIVLSTFTQDELNWMGTSTLS